MASILDLPLSFFWNVSLSLLLLATRYSSLLSKSFHFLTYFSYSDEICLLFLLSASLFSFMLSIWYSKLQG